jgi:hypothetical protein
LSPEDLVNANQPSYLIGSLIGAAIVGILCGCIPLKLAQTRERVGLGWLGFGLTFVAGFLFGLIGALPMAGVMSLLIVIVGSPAKKSKSKRAATAAGYKPRTPPPEAYDL